MAGVLSSRKGSYKSWHQYHSVLKFVWLTMIPGTWQQAKDLLKSSSMWL